MSGDSAPAEMVMTVAVVPFGAVVVGAEREKRPGAWARQIARRLVDRYAGEPALEVRPVFLVAMPESEGQQGYLVFGSTPDETLAAQYGRSLGATHALTGTYLERDGTRRLEATLVDVERGVASAGFDSDIEPGELHLVEPALAAWLARALGIEVEADLATPAAANEPAYAAMLQGMDAEVDATLLRESDQAGSRAALALAAGAYATAVRSDPTSIAIEERILVMGAAAIEADQQAVVLPALEALAEARPTSWRAHYMLGEVRRTSGDVSGAIVALEHSDSLRPLRDADVLTLARLYVGAHAPAVAAGRLRRIVDGKGDASVVATARRLRLGLVHPSAESDLEEAGRIAIGGKPKEFAAAAERIRRVLEVEPELWEAHFASGLLAGRRGDLAEAGRAFRRVLEIHPGQPDALRQLELLGRKRRKRN